MKKIHFCFVIFTALFFSVSCGSESSDTKTEENNDNDGIDTITDSDNGSGDTEAADNDAAHGDKTDSGDSSDSADSTEDNDTDTGNSSTDFDKSCKASGGTPIDGVCVCDKVVCDPGIVCNTETKKCANYVAPECDADTPDTCTNNEEGIGVVTKCQNGHLFTSNCKTVSCNEAGTDCGECLNGSGDVCVNDSEDNGFTAYCNNGTLVKKEDCLKVFYDEDYAEYYESCEHFTSVPDCNEEWLKNRYYDHVSCQGNKCGECMNYSNVCINDEENHGKIYECVNGRAGKHKSDCENGASCCTHFFKCYENLNTCGECVNGDVKCENDASDYAHMYRCNYGKWEEIKGDSDPLSPYSSEASQQAQITVTGYNPNTQKVETFTTTLMVFGSDNKHHISCKNDKEYGVCHNSIQYCVNQERGKRGFIIKCENGVLADYDGNHDNIACTCVEFGNNNGGCSSSRNCYAAQTAASGVEICQPAK